MYYFKRKFLLVGLVVLAVALGSWAVYSLFIAPPENFPKDSVVTIKSGSGLLELSNRLEEEEVIRSPILFRMAAIILGGERFMKAGEYYLGEPESLLALAQRIIAGDHQVKTVKITIPEGFTAKKISNLFDEEFLYFDNQVFERAAPEGYLFPDTYFVPLSATATSTVNLLRDNFIAKVDDLLPEIEGSGKSLEEVVTMASILEAEANTREDREIVAGILWKRLDRGMPLQVDASFVYVNGKTTADLTLDDLKIDSPYNTYIYKGLPPTPISNPGLESIVAALNPTTTPYLYFLTGTDGKMYYARTHDEHVQNKVKYLKSN